MIFENQQVLGVQHLKRRATCKCPFGVIRKECIEVNIIYTKLDYNINKESKPYYRFEDTKVVRCTIAIKDRKYDEDNEGVK